MDWIERETELLGNEHLPGKPVILPSSFTGGKRFMQQNYQDAMAMCTLYKNRQTTIIFHLHLQSKTRGYSE